MYFFGNTYLLFKVCNRFYGYLVFNVSHIRLLFMKLDMFKYWWGLTPYDYQRYEMKKREGIDWDLFWIIVKSGTPSFPALWMT